MSQPKLNTSPPVSDEIRRTSPSRMNLPLSLNAAYTFAG